MEIATIQALRERCPSFKKRVFGSMAWLHLDKISPRDLPCAFVYPISDDPRTPQVTENYYYQEVTSTIGICLCVGSKDAKGLDAMKQLKALREEVFSALLGWSPLGDLQCFYSFGNRRLLSAKELPACAMEQIELTCDYALGYENTYKPTALEKATTEIHTIHGNIDMIADDNKPDGRIEAQFEVKDLW